MNNDDKDTEFNKTNEMKITKIEYIRIWIIQFTLRLINETIPLLISIILALVVAIISSNFDHLMKISLEFLDNIGGAKYLISIVFMSASALFVHIFHPTVRGSGIPEMKLFLANWESPRMKDYLSCKALLTKLIGLGLAILSGFPIGKEGPFVHISCSISYFVKFKMVPFITDLVSYNCRKIMLLSKFVCSKTFKHHYTYWKLNYVRDIDVYRFLCTGCALGVACTFGAPIGGVMFSIEVTSQIFDVSNYWHCFFTGIIGALFFRFFIGGVFHENWYFKPFMKSNLPGEEYEFYHFIVYIGIGIVSGILGSLFILIYYFYFKAGQYYYRIINYLCRKFTTKNTFRLRFFHPRTSPRRIIVTLIFTLSITIILSVGQFFQNQEFLTPSSQHSQLILFFDDGKKLLQNLRITTNLNISTMNKELDLVVNFNNYFRPLLLFLLMQILFFCPVVSCLPIPRGIFFPLMVAGACLGRLLGDMTMISSAGCAIVGAAGLSGAVTHSVSTAVIITEMTEEIQYLLPCAIAAFIGKLIVQITAKYSIYNMMIRNRLMPYMPDDDEEIYSFFRKTDARTFIISGNYISIENNKYKELLILYRNFEENDIIQNLGEENLFKVSSTNGQLRIILQTILNKSAEMPLKLIPVMQLKNSYESLIGYVRCEIATHYLHKYFELINGSLSTSDLYLKDPEELIDTFEKKILSNTFHNCFSKDLFEYNSYEWENFLEEKIYWDEILEEKPCSVTINTRLPDIQTFVQKNFLSQVFVLDGVDLCGIITRENIIEQIKLLHRQSGTLAVSYRGDLQSLPMRIIDSDKVLPRTNTQINCVNENYSSDSNYVYTKLRTHSE